MGSFWFWVSAQFMGVTWKVSFVSEALLPHPLPPDAEQLAVEQEGLKELGEAWEKDGMRM